jgi:2'-5' RNA ligase
VRLFVAVDIPEDILATLEALIARLRPSARIQWSPVSNLHITTKFIGEWPEDRAGEVDAALRKLTTRAWLPISIRGLGFFPNPRAPRVFWAGVEPPAGLVDLAAETERALASLGVESERRAYSPHLTLARIKEPVPLATLHRAISELPSTDFGSFTADRFHLYRSQLQRGGSVYTKLSEYVFG